MFIKETWYRVKNPENRAKIGKVWPKTTKFFLGGLFKNFGIACAPHTLGGHGAPHYKLRPMALDIFESKALVCDVINDAMASIYFTYVFLERDVDIFCPVIVSGADSRPMSLRSKVTI